MAKEKVKAEKPEKEPKVKKVRAKAPKIAVGLYPYVNMVPASRQNEIEVDQAKSKWIKTVGGGVIIAVVIAVAAVGFKVVHQISYDDAVKDEAKVEALILENKDVDQALTIKQGIESNLRQASSTAIKWQDLNSRIEANLPDESSLSSFSALTGGKENDDSVVAILVDVSSQEPIAYSQILTAFGKVEGIVGDSLQIGNLTASTSESGATYSYPVTFTIDNSILADRFDYLDPKKANNKAAEEDDTTAEGNN